jgi:ABC-type transport system substrate-binding protein
MSGNAKANARWTDDVYNYVPMKSTWVLLLLSALLLAGCTGGKFSERANAGNSSTLRYPIPELTKLDPALVQDGDTIDVLHQVFEGLVIWNEASEPTPGLAEKWEIGDDDRTYTFTLKKGVKFHNGREVTADDVKYSLERATGPALKSPTAATYLYAIEGFKDFTEGKAEELRGVKVIDPSTVQITIDKPRPYFISCLTFQAAAVVCKEAVKGKGEITEVSEMVGTGPFIADTYTPDQEIVLKANPDYRDGAPKLERIVRPIIKDAATRLNKFKTGELDLTRIERQDIEGLQNDDKFKDQIKYFPRPSMYYVGFNVTSPPFNDPRIRQAFALAIDKNQIVNETMGGVNEVANAIVPPGLPAHRPDAPAYPFDVERAKKLLAEAGYPGGKGLPTLVMSHRDGQPDVKLVAENVVTQLRQNLGVEAKTQMLPWNGYLDRHTKKELPFFHMRWGADYLDPENFLSTLLASYGNENKINYKNLRYDALCREADSLVGDDERRWELYKEAEDIVLKDAPFIPIYYQRDAELISPRVKNMRESVFGHLPHNKTTLE